MPRRGGRSGLLSLDRGALAGGGVSLDVGRLQLPALIAAAALACIAALVVALHSGTPAVRPASAHGAPASLAPVASASIGRSDPRYWAVRHGASLQTAGGGIHTSFAASGAHVRVAAGTIDLSLASLGRGAQPQPVGAAAPSASGSEVRYSRGSIDELYRNGPYGLEQAFRVRTRPQGGGAALVLALGTGGTLTGEKAGSQILFRTRSGSTALTYGQLSAHDATGRQLPATMQLARGSLQLRIDDRNARYPISIDPFLQQGSKLSGSEEIEKGKFGGSVALSADGNTALIGGSEDNTGVGAAWVFTRSGTTWTQQGPKLTGGVEEVLEGHFGFSVALSSDGNTALIGGGGDNKGVGAAWVFTRTAEAWTQQGKKLLGGTEEKGMGHLGFRVALSADGNTALVGAPGDNFKVGAAWVFTRTAETWTQQGPKLLGAGEIGAGEVGGEFGVGVALSADGNTALIGGGGDNEAVGAVWPFVRSGTTWEAQGAKLTGTGETGKAHFGFNVALSENGNTALVGGGSDNTEVGAAWVFIRSGTTWEQQGAKLTATGETGMGHFGVSVRLSADGNTGLIGGVTDNSEVGAAWVFTRSGTTWSQQGSKLLGGGENGKGLFGNSVALSADASTALVGGPNDNLEKGAVWVFVSPTPTAPTAVTGAASTIKATAATLNATVNPNNSSVTDCHFEYGLTPSYGTSVPCTSLPGTGVAPVPVSAIAEPLTSGTTYHFRIVATNGIGTGEGADQTFTTLQPPEVGRCIKLAKGVKGAYATASCTSPATAEKFGFEWAPGPGSKPKFTTKFKELTTITFETIKKTLVTCHGESGKGEFTGPKSVGGVVITLTGCESQATKCTTTGAATEGEVSTTTLEGVLGWESKPLKHVATDLFPVGHTGTFAEFTCGTTAVQVVGSVLVKDTTGKMVISEILKFTQKAGKEKPERFEGGPLQVLEAKFGEGAVEQTGLNLTVTQTDEELLEINWFV
ncbi:MAG TPA: fibronectin type III domain-containing protein [Solirubrobacteraceae bacterium]|jgi:hypothetical protein|nr:fibronectin type III domain-containing protein [Solirubrobacteraceae bacterium]